MANPVPFTLIQSDPSYVNGDLDTKRELFKIWYQVNKENIGEDEELNNGLLAAADEIREREDVGSTGWEIAGDVGISVGLGLGGAGLGLVTAGPPGAIVGGGVGGLAGADIVQRRELARGDKFDYSVARTLAEGAMNTIPAAGTVGRGVMPVLRAAGKDALRLGAARAAGSIAEQVETRGTVDPLRVATDAAAMGVGAAALRGGFEAIAKPMSRAARRKMSAAELNKLEEQLGRNELTNEEIARVIPYKEMMAEQGAAQEAAREQAMMDDEELASFIRMVQAEEPRQARGFTQDEQTAGLREVPTLGDIELANVEGPLEIARRTRPAVLSAQVFEEANQPKPAAEAAEILLPPDNIEATLSVDDDFIPPVASDTAGFNARVLEELNGFQIKGIPINAQTRQAAAAIARAETSAERGLLRQGVNDLFGQPKAPAPSVKRGTRLTSLADLELPVTQQAEQVPTPATAPSLANQADTAVAAGSLDNVNAEANKIAGAAPVAKQGPVGEQVLEEPAGLTIVTDPEDGSIFVEDGDGNTIDQFASKQDAEDYIAQLARGEDAPDLDEASAMGKTVLAGTDEVVPPAIEEPAGVIRTGPQRMVIEVEGEGKAEDPKSKGWAKGRAEKRLRAIEKELDKLQNETLPVGESRRVRLRRDKKIAELNRWRDALELERLKIQSDMGDERAMASLARYEEDLAAGVKTPAQVIREAMDADRVKISRGSYAGRRKDGREFYDYDGEIDYLLESGLPKRFVAGKTEKGQVFDEIRDVLNPALEGEGYPTLETEADVINALENAFSGGTGKRIEPKRVEMELPAANRGKAKVGPTPEVEKNLPAWARERMEQEGINPNRKFNDADLENQSMQDALALESPEALAAEGIVLKDGKYVYARKPVVEAEIGDAPRALGVVGKAKAFAPVQQGDKVISVTSRDDTPTWQVTRFTDDGLEIPAGHNGHETLADALKDVKYAGDETKGVSSATAEDLAARFEAGKQNSGAVKPDSANNYFYSSPMRPLNGIKIKGTVQALSYKGKAGGLRGFLEMDRPLTLDEMAKFDLVPINAKSDSAYWNSLADAVYPDHAKVKAGKSARVSDDSVVVDTEVDIPRVDFNKASAADVEKWADDVADYERNIDEKILGKELAAEYKRASRIANSSQYVASDPKVKEADAVIARIEESLTPEQSDIFFGRALPKGFIGKDDAKKFASAVSDIEGAEDMGELVVLTSGLGRAMIAARTGNGSLGPLDTALAARLGSKVKSLGGDEIDYIAGVVARRLDLDGADAPEILGITNEQAQQLLQEAANRKRGNASMPRLAEPDATVVASKPVVKRNDDGDALGIVGNATLPSAGEPIIGAVAGFGLTQQEEGESDEAYQERRLQNALLGMGVMSLGAAGIRRLASKMGVEQAGIQLERLGAAAQSAAKPAAKKQTREELMAQVVKLNEIIAAQTKGTRFEGMSAATVAAAQAGPDKGFNVDDFTAKQREAKKKAREGDNYGKSFLGRNVEKAKEFASDMERKLSSVTDGYFRRRKADAELIGYDFEQTKADVNNYGKNNQKIAANWIDNHAIPLRSLDGNEDQGTMTFSGFYRTPIVGKSELEKRSSKLGVTKEKFIQNVEALLEAKQALNLYMRGYTPEQVGNMMSKEEAENLIGALDKDYGSSARFVNDLNKDLLTMMVDTGLVEAADADYWTKLSPDFIPFNRIFSAEEIAELGGSFQAGRGIASVNASDLIKKREGSTRLVDSPLDGLVKKVFAVHAAAGKNTAARSLANMEYELSKKSKDIIAEPLYRIAADDTPMLAEGLAFELSNGKFQLVDANKKPVVDVEGNPVFLDKSQVNETSQGNYVGDGTPVKSRDAAKNEPTISFMHKGHLMKMVVSKEVENMAKGLNVTGVSALGKLMRIPVGLARAGFVGANIAYAIPNMMSDLQTQLINTKGYKDIPKLIGSYGSSLKDALYSYAGNDSPLMKAYRGYGGAFFGKDLMRDQSKEMPNISRMIKPITQVDWSTPGRLFKGFEDFISVSETTGRLNIFKNEADKLAKEAIENGAKLTKNPDTNMWEGPQAIVDRIYTIAGEQSMERTANYLNRGNWSTAANAILLFFHANVAGTRSNVRAFKNDPVAWAIKVVGGLGGATALATYYNLSDPERAEIYTNIPESDRENNLIFVAPNAARDDEGNPLVFRIKLPPGMGRLAQTPRRVVEGFYGFNQQNGTPDLFTKAMSDVFTAAVPLGDSGLSTLLPQAVRPIIEASDSVNKNLFSGQNVVPRQLTKRPSEDQWDQKTSLTARKLGGLTGISPKKLDYVTDASLGSISKFGKWVGDAGIGAVTGEEGPVSSPLGQVVDRFTKGREGEQLNRFYASYDKSSKIYEGIKSAMNNGDEERARELISDHPVELRNYQVLNGILQKMTQLSADIRTLESLVDKRPDLKDDIQLGRQQLTELARLGNQMVNEQK